MMGEQLVLSTEWDFTCQDHWVAVLSQTGLKAEGERSREKDWAVALSWLYSVSSTSLMEMLQISIAAPDPWRKTAEEILIPYFS